MDGAIEGFTKWETRHATELGFRDLGFQDFADEERRRLSTLAEGYATKLRAALEDVPVEVLPFPDVDHRVLVERTTGRVPPCKKDGTGYRDTLNWLSLLEVAKDAQGGDTLLWVSGDGDFASPEGSDLHPLLQAELKDKGLGEITLVRELSDAALAASLRRFLEPSNPGYRLRCLPT
jgi:hypothetical protein